MAKEIEKQRLLEKSLYIAALFNCAIKKGIQRRREKGIASVYSLNGHLIYDLPDGSLSLTPPDLETLAPTKPPLAD